EKILYVNPASAKALGYDADKLVGTSLILYIAKEYRDEVVSRISERRKGGEVSPYEIELLTRDEHRRSVIVKGTLINYQNNPAYLLLFVDITDRKVSEETIRQANKKLTLLSGITRHDINNQLTVQMGYISLLEMKQLDPTQNEYFQKVSTAAQRISAMVQFTEEYEEIGAHAPAWQECRTLVDTAAKQAPLGKVLVKNDLIAGAEVFADPLIGKVFYNLMDNAARSGGKITTIRLSIQESGDEHLIVCEDDGDGVVTKEKEKIFERGFGKNTGLGLALAREILDITGITITETGEPGKGARFELTVAKGMWRMDRNDA
ncbi:MAG: PAS domain-containing sensor histidine kinase, partial [Methanomicrobiales archaeon]|nr:PAS domain-containing sensor histidine kinase [Methanomicrobiales archaeon]